MPVYVETGVLLRVFHRPDPAHESIKAAAAALLRNGVTIFTGLQQRAEFWNVTTRPPGERGGFNLPVSQAARRLRFIQRSARVLTDTPATPQVWETLVEKHEVKGVKVHDARTVALMLTYSITDLLTLDCGDFKRYEANGVRILTPADVLAQYFTPGD